MSRRVVLVVAAIAAMVAVASGCGGSDGTAETTAGASLSKAEFVKQVNRICAQGTQQVTAEFNEYVEKTSSSSSGKSRDEVLAIAAAAVLPAALERRISEINAVGTPREGQGEIDEYLGAMQDGVDTIQGESVTSLNEFEQIFEKANGIAKSYGLTECA